MMVHTNKPIPFGIKGERIVAARIAPVPQFDKEIDITRLSADLGL